MVVGWLAVAVPLGVFTVFGGAYGVATAVWRERGSRLVDRYGQYVYLAAILAAAVPLAVLAWPSGGLRLPDRPLGVAGGTTVAVVAGLAAGVGAYLFELIVSHRLRRTAAGRSSIMEGRTDTLRSTPADQWPRTAAALVIAVAEEVVFRGVGLLGLVHAGLHPGAALAVTSAAFGINHVYFGLRNVAFKTVDGLVWGALALLGGSVLAAVLAHLAFQSLVMRRLNRAALTLRATAGSA